MRGAMSLEWGVFLFASHGVCGIAVERGALPLPLRTVLSLLANGARNLLHIAPSSLWSTPYSCSPLSGRVIRSRSLQAHLGKKSSLEWDLMHYAGHRPGRLAAHYRPSAHAPPIQLHFFQNTPPGALSLQQGPSRAARRRRASTCIFAIFERIPGETVKGPEIGVRNSATLC